METPIPSKWIINTDSSKAALKEVLGRNAAQLANTMEEWDADKSGTIEKREFIKAFNTLMGAREEWATDHTGAGALFDELDKDGSGYLDISEIRNFQKTSTGEVKAPKRESWQGMPVLTIDMNSDKSITTQLADHLRKHSRRILDLFKSWDDDHNMSISRDEFHMAMKKLGVITAHVKVIDGLFDAFDLDGSGEVEFRELELILLKKKEIFLDHELGKEKPEAGTPDTAGAGKKHRSRIGGETKIAGMCEALGYPSFMSMSDYLEAESTATYQSVPEAKVEHILHALMPLRKAEAPEDGNTTTVNDKEMLDEEEMGKIAAAAPVQRRGSPPNPNMKSAKTTASATGEMSRRRAAAAAAAAFTTNRDLFKTAAEQVAFTRPWILSVDQLRRPATKASVPALEFDPPPSFNVDLPGLTRTSCAAYQVEPPPAPEAAPWEAMAKAHWQQFGQRQQSLHDRRLDRLHSRQPHLKPPHHLPVAYYQAQQLESNQARHKQKLEQAARPMFDRATEAVDELHRSTHYRSPLDSTELRLRHAVTRMPRPEVRASLFGLCTPPAQLNNKPAVLPKLEGTVSRFARTASQSLIVPPTRTMPMPSSQRPGAAAAEDGLQTSSLSWASSPKAAAMTLPMGQVRYEQRVQPSMSMPSLLPSHGRLGRLEAPFIV